MVFAAWIAAVILSLAAPAALAAENSTTPPTLLPTRSSPVYPRLARNAKVEGLVRFRAAVSAEGAVEEVEILEVPKEGLGFEEAVREVLTYWRFEPARTDGVAVRGEYEGQFEFFLTYPMSKARMYPIASEELRAGLKGLMKELKFKLLVRKDSLGVYVTRWMRLDSAKQFPALRPFQDLPGAVPVSAKLHIFVSPFAEPARIYISTMVDSTVGKSYNSGHIENWFYGQLEERLGLTGAAIPKTPKHRWTLATKLTGATEPDPCAAVVPLDPTAEDRRNPAILPETRIRPIFPDNMTREQENIGVHLRARIYEDGSVGDMDLVRSNSSQPGFARAAADTVSFWRYRPAMVDGCPVAVYFDILVRFRLY